MKKIVVLGAKGGIGKAVCRAFKKDDVYAFDIDKIDLRSESSLYILPARIDILVNCAGVFSEDYNQAMDVNVDGFYDLFKHLYENNLMLPDSYIFNVTSYTSIKKSFKYPIYSFSKFCAEELTKEVAFRFIKKDVYVNSIIPSRTRTLMRKKVVGKKWIREKALEPEYVADIIKKIVDADLKLWGNAFILNMRL